MWSEQGPVEGEVEVKKSAWVFPQAPVVTPLEHVHVFRRGYFNTFYAVRIRPRVPVTVDFG